MSDTQQAPRSLADRLDAWLPQTQCTQCGYPRCRAYAEALARGEADINQCPPGGEITIQALTSLLHIAVKPLDRRFGSPSPRAQAEIVENLCIGCRKCIDACPVEAIVGAHKQMHTVLSDECTGCELCLPPCPVDCIVLVPSLTGHARSASGSPPSPLRGRGSEGEGEHGDPWMEYTHAEANRWRTRTERRLLRLQRRKHARRNVNTKAETLSASNTERELMRAEIHAAVKRVKARKTRQSGRVS